MATTWDEGLKSIVQVNMGDTSAVRTVASSALITMERPFQVDSFTKMERYQLGRAFKSQLRSAGLKITSVIGHYEGTRFKIDFDFASLYARFIASGGGGVPYIITRHDTLGNPRKSSYMKKQSYNYVLRYTISYDRNPGGFWKDYANSVVGASYHRFEFSRI